MELAELQKLPIDVVSHRLVNILKTVGVFILHISQVTYKNRFKDEKQETNGQKHIHIVWIKSTTPSLFPSG